ncbi:RodZ domain-containing protein [Marinobacter sp. SS21]|uniref:RodZ domain-containing protein n=1 Tax=Marinobacter sp. SS21 TaxID=2979460 RepID=UPI00232A9139|nr:RodZ domain-containing protein [Marinobacter sp. SS21]MDC0663302.1 DUF4115 domain-containing protein [Marinobacter sp. SS21]
MSNDETGVQPTSNPSIGSQLKAAREGRGLQVADIARGQHLRPAVIQAIESGNFGEIGSELFLKGYVRTYASQVGLDAQSLIAQLDTELEPLRREREQERQSHPLVTIEERKHRKRRLVRGLLFLVFAMVVGFLSYKLVIEDIDGSGSPVATEESADDSDATVLSESDDKVEPMASEPDSGPFTERAADPQPAVEEVQAVEAVEARAPPIEDVETDVASVPVQPEPEQAPAPAEPSAPAAVPVESAPSAAPTAVASGQVNLQLTFSADCWVQVTDAAGRRLASRLRRSGERLDVSGTPPLQVVIGAVDAIDSIRFQGQAVDLSDYRVVNNRTEFSLGN